MVARNRAETCLDGSIGRFPPARHHESLPSNPKKDCTRSRSALRHAPLRLATTDSHPSAPALALGYANPLLGAV